MFAEVVNKYVEEKRTEYGTLGNTRGRGEGGRGAPIKDHSKLCALEV